MPGPNGSPDERFARYHPSGQHSDEQPTRPAPAGYPAQPVQPGYQQPGHPQPGYPAQPVQPGYPQSDRPQPVRPRSGRAQPVNAYRGGGAEQGPMPQGLLGQTGYQQPVRPGGRPAGPPMPPGPPGGPPRGPGGPGGPRGRAPRPKRFIDYPRHHRSGWTRWLPSWKLVTSVIAFVLVSAITTVVAVYASTSAPTYEDLTILPQGSTVYYDDGKTVLTRFAQSDANRSVLTKLNQIAPALPNAVMSAEDRTFLDNKGFSPLGILRAAWADARGKSLQGGSTITQQLVKNTETNGERSLQRKVKEFFISLHVANDLDKDEVMLRYLNTIYWGRGVNGIQAASRAWFGEDAKNLKPDEAAFLAGIISGPDLFDPASDDAKSPDHPHADRALGRYRYVLDGMVTMGTMTSTERDKYAQKLPVVKPQQHAQAKAGTREDDQTVYLTSMVRNELSRFKDPNGGKLDLDKVRRGGYKITTTFKKNLIDQAVKSVHDEMGKRNTWPEGTQVGLVTLDPLTGGVEAIYGGDGVRSQSAATQDAPQAGSTFKAFALLAAVGGKSRDGSDGISLTSRFSGASPYKYKEPGSGATVKIGNLPGEPGGMVDLPTATEMSINTAFIRLNAKIGPERTMQAAIRAGIPETQVKGEITNVLGNASVSALDMASAYGTIAAGGKHAEPFVISKIATSEGGIIGQWTPKPVQEFSDQVTADVTQALRQPIEGREGTARVAKEIGRPAAGKTGTVGTTGRSATKAAWFVGFTAQLSTAVVVHRLDKDGNPADVKTWGKHGKNKDMFGGMFPAEVWTNFMKAAHKGVDVKDFPAPANVGQPINPAPPPAPSPDPNADPNADPNNGGGTGQQGDPNQSSPPGGQGQGQNQDGTGQSQGQNQDGTGQSQGNGQGNGNGNNGQSQGTNGQDQGTQPIATNGPTP